MLRTLAVFALSEGEQEERRPDGAQHTGSEPVVGKNCVSLLLIDPM
jgi:hypothetical protein